MLHLKFTKIEGLEEFKRKYIEFLRKEGLEAGLYEVRKETQDRVKRGLDESGVAFKEYADQTKRIKKKLGQQTDPVNLRDTGGMMNSLSIHRDAEMGMGIDDYPVLTVGEKHGDKARWTMDGSILGDGESKRPARKFLGINTGNSTLMGRIKDAIARAWNKRSR